MEGYDENEDVATFRKHIRDNGPSEEALALAPKWLGFESRMLEHLIDNPDDFLGAFKKLPNNLQLMTIHAAQSIIFNKSLNLRIASGLPISTPVEGDLVGRVDEKGQLNVNSCVTVEKEHCLESLEIVNLADLFAQDLCLVVRFLWLMGRQEKLNFLQSKLWLGAS